MTDKTINLIRVLSKMDKKTLSQKALKVAEEAGELAKVVLPYDSAHNTSHKFIDKERILEEVIDTYLASISIAYSLDFTDDEINKMIDKKTKKWVEIQNNDVDNKLPFEIHISITNNTSEGFIDKFIEDCKIIEVKPIVIDLEVNSSIIKDFMTSSKHMGDNRSAYDESIRIVDCLTAMGYDVVRNKIESVPWHPAAPKLETDETPKGCYFESHIGVKIDKEEKELLNQITQTIDLNLNGSARLSQNFFKKSNDGKSYINMLTYRDDSSFKDKFLKDVEYIKNVLTCSGFEYEKVEVEYAVYDTNKLHDSDWING